MSEVSEGYFNQIPKTSDKYFGHFRNTLLISRFNLQYTSRGEVSERSKVVDSKSAAG